MFADSFDLDIIHLRNDVLEVSVLPEVGAKFLDLIHRPTGHNFLWHNPRIRPQRYPIESNFDNYWCGGWDDGFPTCEACAHNGEQYPNLGELRSVNWNVDACITGTAEPSLRLSAFGPISAIRAEKNIRLRGNTVEMEFGVENVGHLPMDFIWGTHPAYAIEPGCVIHIPARTGIVSQANRPLLGEPGQRYDWPFVRNSEGSMDMSHVLEPGEYAAGHYATDLEAGWYAIEYPDKGLGLLFEFPLEVCPYLWLWLSYGGWRGYYLAAIEPWTSCPVTLSEAVAAETHRVLRPGAEFSCTVRSTPWQHPQTLNDLLKERGLPRL
jgi:galactose mutarotase-like enzyme